jgi:hypothetical protein
MQNVLVDGLPFQFPDDWHVTKLDDWPFYRNHFRKMWDHIKAVDLGAIDGDTLWLIEAKDYRAHPQPKSKDLIASVAKKVADSLACLMAAQHNAHDLHHQRFAKKACCSQRVHVVFHLEQSIAQQRHLTTFRTTRSTRSTRSQQQALRQLIRPIDPRARVISAQRCYPLQ